LRTVLTTFALALATIDCSDDAPLGSGGATSSSGSGATDPGAGGHMGTSGISTTGSGGDGAGAGWPMPIPSYCDLCVVSDGFPVANVEIDEASGIVASAVHDDMFYVNNDSGDLARFFAVGADGADRGTFTLEAGTHDDFEDIALGPCAVGHCIYVGDIGDNDEVRTFYTVYRVPEPSAVGPGPQTVFPTQLKYKFPDGSHNSEALIVHPITGEVVLIQKVPSGQPAGIYKAPDPWPANTIVTLTREGELAPEGQSTTITGADVHPLGHGILVRTFDGVLYFAAAGPEEPIAETLAGTPCVMPSVVEPQGEAIAWTKAGDGYVTVSEGTGAPVNHVICSEKEASP
jgi:hypothetical protein